MSYCHHHQLTQVKDWWISKIVVVTVATGWLQAGAIKF